MKVICAGPGGRLAFEGCDGIIEAWRTADVAPAFERAERALARGKYVAGFVTYEAGSAFVPRQDAVESVELPLLCLGIYDAPRPVRSDACDATSAGATGALIGPLVPLVSRARYAADIATILASIRAGDVYQVNYAVPFGFGHTGDASALFDALAGNDAYPYAALVEDARWAFVSCSPELFVERSGDRIVTKPMKGTARLDARSELDDAKNRAEHVMIVDLLRNDLHRLSGDVTVERLFEVETYPRFLAMTSTIAANVSPDVTLAQTFAAMFPCGSVTGAPKVAAMRSIAATERRERGIFCGSIGYAAPDRSGIWNVAIRTAAIDKRSGRGTLHVGGGIVADSGARSEWAEIVTKRSFLEAASPAYALLETMWRERDGAIAYLEAHMHRLRCAADDLHFDLDERAIASALQRYVAAGPAILRLQLERDGTFAVTHRPAPTIDEPVSVRWASETLDSAEPLLRYKTTWRPHYDVALAEAAAHGCFDALLRNERGEVADGARTTIFVRRGSDLVTPPLTSGALPGILRRRLVLSGAAREGVLTESDIAYAEELFVGNSVRGLLRASLQRDV